jgi:hypothetical protein
MIRDRAGAEAPEKVTKRQIDLLVCQRDLGTIASWARWRKCCPPDTKFRWLTIATFSAPDYLRRVIVPLADSAIGMVTCLYRGIASSTLGCAQRLGSAPILFRCAERTTH